ncbi:MAG: molybdopterin molybdotransferase MoeA, partial [Hyphomicrobiaceae bacterium]
MTRSPTRKLLDDCFLHDRDRLKHAEAVALLRERITPLTGTESVALEAANGRVLAEDAVAERPVPAHTNSAVDGFGLAVASLVPGDETRLDVVVRVAAGHATDRSVPRGAAARIFTGAVLPEGVDTVAMQEDCEVAERDDNGDARVILVPSGLKAGANVRKAGEDVAAGAALLEAGALLRPQDLAALASIGVASVTCRRRLSVAVISSGDEIVRPGARPLGKGEVYDANAPMLVALARAAGAEVTDLGVWPDDESQITSRLREAAQRFDVLLTSGGASRGEEDHMVAALDALGKRHLWQLAVKPGRPMSFGQIGDTIMVGLPGNPVAVFVCFLMYVFPMLRRLGGAPWREPRRYPLPAGFKIGKRKTGRREFLRG